MPRQILHFALLLGLINGGSQLGLAADVSYSGRVFLGDTPVVGGFVIAGTFKPGFDVSNYTCFYGDIACNLDDFAYGQAVGDGNFIPIGSGDLTDSNGAFSAAGTTNAAAGTPLWLFAFENDSTNTAQQVLASSSDATWVVPAQPAGLTEIVASAANIFELGESHPLGVTLTGVPVPEPNSACIAAVCMIAMSLSRRIKLARRGQLLG